MNDIDIETRKWLKKFVTRLILSITALPFIMWMWPGSVPFGFFELWHIKGTIMQWIYSALPFFAYGVGMAVLCSFLTRNHSLMNRNAEDFLTKGTITSIIAGVGEEISCRWLIFLLGIVTVKIVNYLFFGFLGFGISEWMYMHVFGPLANWTTLGYLEGYLFHSSGWAVGAGLLSANALFRDGHKYQGIFGWVNSWFAGMYLFWILFQHGLIAAIFVHFMYDFLIYFVRYIDAAVERAQGY